MIMISHAATLLNRLWTQALTRGVDAEIPIALQVMMWQAVDQMPEPKDYLQVFRLSEENGLQIVHHTSEQLQFEMTYIVEEEKRITAKVYIIDDGEHCTMLLAEEYWLKVL